MKKNGYFVNEFIAPNIYLNVDKDGVLGNCMLMLSRIYKHKGDIPEMEEEDNLIFELKKDFNSSMLHIFTKERASSVVSMKELVKGHAFLSMKVLPATIWEMDLETQRKVLREIKDTLMASIVRREGHVSNLIEAEVIMSPEYTKLEKDRAYFKKINTDFYFRSRAFYQQD